MSNINDLSSNMTMGTDYTPARFSQRYADKDVWCELNPILAEGEIGIESDTGFFKIGDGKTVWNNLQYNISSTKIFKADIDNKNNVLGIIIDCGDATAAMARINRKESN